MLLELLFQRLSHEGESTHSDTVATDAGQRLSVEQRTRVSVFHRDVLSVMSLSVATNTENFTKYASIAWGVKPSLSNGPYTWRTARASDAEAASVAKAIDASVACVCTPFSS
jgi:hypothetical protein